MFKDFVFLLITLKFTVVFYFDYQYLTCIFACWCLTFVSLATAPNLRQKLRVRMINAQGLEEAGVDGGGVFR